MMKETEQQSGERFRKGFVLVMTLAYTIMFFAMLPGVIGPLLSGAAKVSRAKSRTRRTIVVLI